MVLGLDPPSATLIATAVLAAALLALALRKREFRTSPLHIASGLGVGLLVIAGWVATSILRDELSLAPARVTSLTFVGPTAELLSWTGTTGPLQLPGFAVASVGGTALGALLVALLTGTFRLEGFADTADAARSLLGGAMMGVGGVLALGCTIGQGITGLATLSLGSLLTLVAIITGARIGLAALMWSVEADA
ncbi:MAG: YeeE/YedE thiosulfate transporter family protein [Hyphomicrobiaceae bacterium]